MAKVYRGEDVERVLEAVTTFMSTFTDYWFDFPQSIEITDSTQLNKIEELFAKSDLSYEELAEGVKDVYQPGEVVAII